MSTFTTTSLDLSFVRSNYFAPGGNGDRMMTLLGERLVIRARVTCPRDSFQLANSIFLERNAMHGYDVIARQPYAWWVHQGTKRGPEGKIVPRTVGTSGLPLSGKRKKTWLRWREGGKVIFMQKATHGKTPRQPWLFDALIDEVRAL